MSLERGFPHSSGTSLQGDACPWKEVFLTLVEPLFKGTRALGKRFSSLKWNLSSRGRVPLERGFPHFSGTSLQGDACPWKEVFLIPVEPLFKGTDVLGERFSSLQWNLSSRGRVSLERGFPHSSGTSLQGDACPWKEVFLTLVEPLFKGTCVLEERFSAASMLSVKWNQPYSATLCWIRNRLLFSLLRSVIQCIRGACSSTACHHSSPLHLLISSMLGCAVAQLSQSYKL